MDSPGAWNQDMDRDEASATRLAGAQRVPLDPTLLLVAIKHGLNRVSLIERQGPIEQARDRSADEPGTGPDDVDRYRQRNQRIEPFPAGYGPRRDSTNDARGGHYVRHQMSRVGLQGDGVIFPPGLEQPPRHPQV